MGLPSVTNRELQQLPKRQFGTTAEKQSTVTPEHLCFQTQGLSQCIYHADNEKHQKCPLFGVPLRLHVTV